MAERRSVIIYPNVPAPQPINEPGAPARKYRKVAPQHGYRLKTGQTNPENPAGRTHRPNVPRGKITGSNQILDEPRAGWDSQALSALDAARLVFDGSDLKIESRFDHAIVTLTKTFSPAADWTNLQLGGNARLYPNIYAAGSANAVGDSFLTTISKAVIGLVASLPSLDDPFELLNLTNAQVVRNLEDLEEGATMMEILQGGVQQRPGWELSVQFLMEETNAEGDTTMYHRGVNKYESWFLNPEVLKNVPGRAADFSTDNPNSRAFRLVNLAHPLWALDLFVMIWRWHQHYQHLPYNASASFVGVALTFRQAQPSFVDLTEEYGESIPQRYQPPAAFNIGREITSRMKVGNALLSIHFPVSSSNNCYLHALNTLVDEKKLTASDRGETVRAMQDLWDQCDNTDLRINCARGVAAIPSQHPVDIYSEGAVTIAHFFNVAVRILNTKGEVLREIMWYGATRKMDLLYLDNAETRKHFSAARKENTVYGHLGVIKGTASPTKKCSKCSRLYVDVHTEEACLKQQVHHQGKTDRMKEAYEVHAVEAEKNGVVTTKRPDNPTKKGRKTDCEKECIFYDFETLNVPEKDEITPYAVGIYHDGKYTQYLGKDVMTKFMSYLRGKKKMGRYATRLVAWNGARFDAKLILRYVQTDPLWREAITVSDLVINGGRLLGMTLSFDKGAETLQYKLFDPCLFFMSSLRVACDAFGIDKENSKTSFPHKRMRSIDSLYEKVCVDDMNRAEDYYDSKKNKFELEKEWSVKDFEGSFSVPLSNVVEKYLKLDVMSMKLLCEKLFGMILERCDYDAWCYMTVSHMAFVMWNTSLPFTISNKIRSPPSIECYSDLKSATYGGRVFVGQRKWCSPLLQNGIYEEIVSDAIQKQYWMNNVETKKDYDNMSDMMKDEFSNEREIDNTYGLTYDMKPNEYLIECDFYSLYPSVMLKYKYPVGDPVLHDCMEPYQTQLYKDGTLQAGVYYTKHKAPNNLYIPALPQRVDGELKWNLLPGEGWYTSVDIETAWAAGYEIELVKGWVYAEVLDVFSDYVMKGLEFKKEGDENGNGVLRAFGKLLLNALYGKMLQALQLDHTESVTTKPEYIAFMEKYAWTGALFIGDACILSGVKTQVDMNRPYQFGAFVLAYSRRANWEKFAVIDPTHIQRRSKAFPTLDPGVVLQRSSVTNSVVYADTDSMYIRGDQTRGLDLRNEICCLKDEDLTHREKQFPKPGGKRILLMICLSVKTYCYLMINSANKLSLGMASKGIVKELPRFTDYLEGAANYGVQGYEGRSIDMGNSLRCNISKTTAAKEFSRMHSVNLARRFNLTPMSMRVLLNGELEPDPAGTYTVPYGHALARGLIEECDNDVTRLIREIS